MRKEGKICVLVSEKRCKGEEKGEWVLADVGRNDPRKGRCPTKKRKENQGTCRPQTRTIAAKNTALGRRDCVSGMGGAVTADRSRGEKIGSR